MINQLFEENFVKEAITEFVRKVYLLLESPIYQDLVCWGPDERTLVVKDAKRLLEEVLPVVFKQKTLKSFVRQLNMYNFKKLKNGDNPKYMYFRNAHFRRGNIQSLIFIKRKQRGYVEKTKLQNIESKTLLEKYRIFANGILFKLKNEVSQLTSNHPKICDGLIAMMDLNNVPPIQQGQDSCCFQVSQDRPLASLDCDLFGHLIEQVGSSYHMPLDFRSDLSSRGEYQDTSFIS